MAFADKFHRAMQAIESAGIYFTQEQRIIAWPDCRPGQRVAALCILVLAYHRDGIYPTAHELGAFLGISAARAEALFDGLEHPPFALTKVGSDTPRFLPSQTLEYGKG